MLLLFYKSFPVIAQYLIYTSLNLTVPLKLGVVKAHIFYIKMPIYFYLNSSSSLSSLSL
ncbi:hypothetical protein [Rickettsia sp. MEAM1 (Bemisia tabaci)]|uniref:hypothetical protein n=1 Tax=Rickettsia sp. MEAM1 (Bemisia tabaci) TaxID=1182263 RepID=UPI0012FD04F4|nr:hypothetical protein [Rickettsia sp. MEAM1 (Bemisia tabaci)]